MRAALGMALAAALWLGAAAGHARAVPIPIAPSPDGFDAGSFGLMADYEIPSASDWLPAGAAVFGPGLALSIAQSAMVLNDPDTPTPSDPFRVRLDWTVTNATQQTFDEVLLFLPRLSSHPDDPDYSSTPVTIEFDSAPFVVVRYDDVTTEHYLGWLFQDLAPGESTAVSFEFSVLGPLPPDPLNPSVDASPVLGTAAAANFVPVPEPAVVALLGGGLLGILCWRQGRWA